MKEKPISFSPIEGMCLSAEESNISENIDEPDIFESVSQVITGNESKTE